MAASFKRRPAASRQMKDPVHLSKEEKKEDIIVKTNPNEPWAPAAQTAFKLLMSARLCAAVWNIITDCDETYNYWEPTHFLMFGKGFQTWEYSPQYAIRSYSYLWLHSLPMRFYHRLFGGNKVVLFYFLRCCLGISCAFSELYFYRGVCKQFGANTGRLTLWYLLFSSGMFISCTAYLPSSFSMYFTFVSMGAWYMGHHKAAIFAVAASTLIGWPFSAALGLPIAFDLLIRRRKFKFFFLWSVVSFGMFAGPSMQLDSEYYGKLVLASFNIIMYNVFSAHGPDLYGVEPMSYYFINGFLNFNFIFLLSLLSLPLYVRLTNVIGAFPMIITKLIMKRREYASIPVWLSILPLYIWIVVFFTRPHKEERFLFPIYPFIGMCGALSLDYIQKWWTHLFQQGKQLYHYTDNTGWIPGLIGVVYSLLCMSRTVAIYQNYHAPMDIYLELHKISNDPKIHTLLADKAVNLCTGKEWYRFPSNFFLPGDNWNLQFVKSEFKGQLPRPYASDPDATKIIHSDFNDLNLEESSRYINISRCHYLIDLDTPDSSKYEPRYSENSNDWKILASVKFLDANRSHRFFRAFYIPFLTSKYCSYINYNLLKTTKTKKSTKHKQKEAVEF